MVFTISYKEHMVGIEITEFQKEGYKPLVDFKAWRVAVLRYCDDLKLENIHTMQKHMLTDEVFVLLEGSCSLFSAGSEKEPDNFEKLVMEKHKIYVVKKGVWHNHIMSEDGAVLIVENRNTSDENSPIWELDSQEIGIIRTL